jgi:hypothetical protein
VNQVSYIIQQLQVDDCLFSRHAGRQYPLPFGSKLRAQIFSLAHSSSLTSDHTATVSDSPVNPEIHFKNLSHLDIQDLVETSSTNTYIHSQQNDGYWSPTPFIVSYTGQHQFQDHQSIAKAETQEHRRFLHSKQTVSSSLKAPEPVLLSHV